MHKKLISGPIMVCLAALLLLVSCLYALLAAATRTLGAAKQTALWLISASESRGALPRYRFMGRKEGANYIQVS